jgi:hypothetical protein
MLQIPFVLFHELYGTSYRDLVELFVTANESSCPITHGISHFFFNTARSIQQGGPEFCKAPEWLNSWWPADEHAFIKLFVQDHLDAFFLEAEQLLRRMPEKAIGRVPIFLHEAIVLNKELLKRPFKETDKVVRLNHNVYEFYKSVLEDNRISLAETPCEYTIHRRREIWRTWDHWFREVVWYGFKRAAYLYDITKV